jgi:hypothetical protein
MKPTSTKKAETPKASSGIRYSTSPSYYFHPDEDFKEDYDWKKNKMMSKTNIENAGKIVLR